ncbi:flavin reductase family protein [Paraburkholderia mimosarum]|uniref:flavin reductase family protein n=1 Tax=Paraburkholderia mimosarum TaxID=312026 RepID=UPI0039C02664
MQPNLQLQQVHHTMTPADTLSFKQAMRHLAGGVTVLVALQPDGTPAGIAATAVCSVSAEPASLLACINQSSSVGKLVATGIPFTVNVLSVHHEALARAFGGMSGHDQTSRFGFGQWHLSPEGVPVLDGSLVAFACRVEKTVAHGSHLVVIGRVEHVALPADQADTAPNLVYHNGTFGRFISGV